MTLPSSGPLSFSAMNVELQRSATATLSMNDSAIRLLAQVSSGAISLNDLKGKSAWTPTFNPPGDRSVLDGVTISHAFSIALVLTGSYTGTPTYNWYFTNIVHGTWSVQSGQGTASPILLGFGAINGIDIQATVNCDVTLNGVTKTVSAVYLYSSSFTPHL